MQNLFQNSDQFVVAIEIETTRGIAMGEPTSKAATLAHELAEYDGVNLLCITDNPGGHPQIRPEILGETLLKLGQEVVINFSCKDYNRNGIESRLWALASTGLNNVMALTGDYPSNGFGGQAKPVFDVDSVGVLEMIRQMNEGLRNSRRKTSSGISSSPRTSFYPGASVSPYKRLENEYVPQLHKLELKVRTGARWIVTQIGYDSRRLDDLRRYMSLKNIGAPMLGSVFILSGPAARFFSRWGIPGVSATPELVALTEHHSLSRDRGKAFFLEFAAKQLAVLKGLGYRGVYLSGRPRFEDIKIILNTVNSFGSDDWKQFAKEIAYSQHDEFYYFKRDGATGLASNEITKQRPVSKSLVSKIYRGVTLPLPYTLGNLVHGLIFDSQAPGASTARYLYGLLERIGTNARKIAHGAEQAIKVPLYGCKDCGDCSLPETAYLCPESQCVKNQRNGPCGGTRDGLCEVVDKECIWSRVYDRLNPIGEGKQILERPVIIKNGALQGTSAWANTLLGRDHTKKNGPSPPNAVEQ